MLQGKRIFRFRLAALALLAPERVQRPLVLINFADMINVARLSLAIDENALRGSKMLFFNQSQKCSMLKNQLSLEIGTKINHLEASEMSMPRTLSERSVGVNRCLEGMERLRWN